MLLLLVVLAACLSWDWPARADESHENALRYAKDLVARYDADADGLLDRDEWSRMREAPPAKAFDQGESVSAETVAEELTAYHGHLILVRDEKLAEGINPTPPKVESYCRRLLGRYDRDGDGQLQEVEWRRMPGSPCWADSDRDTVVSLDELSALITHYGQGRSIRLMPLPTAESQPPPKLLDPATTSDSEEHEGETPTPVENGGTTPSSATPPSPGGITTPIPSKRFSARLPAGLPEWFARRDLNGDGQLTRREYAPDGRPTAQAEFTQLDRNRDNVLTAREYLRATRSPTQDIRPPSPAGIRNRE